MTTKITAQDRRSEFINTAFSPLRDEAFANGAKPELSTYQAIADLIVSEGPTLGRTERWQNACAWFANTEDPIDWVVLQGSIWLSHANI